LSRNPEAPLRSLDHLVLAVRDLDAAGRLYERLGFQVGTRNRHPWGTENRIIQFPGAFLELIAVADAGAVPPHGDGTYSFGAFVRDYLARREGFAMLVLDSTDAVADAARFAASGIGAFEPFFFERRGRRPDGSETSVAFTLAFAHDPGAAAGFFVCQQHHPENFWNEAFQRHPNGAAALSSVAIAAADPDRHRAFLQAFTGAIATSDGHDLRFPLARGRLDLLTPDGAAREYGPVDIEPHGAALVGFSVRVGDLARPSAAAESAGIPARPIGDRIVVPPAAAFGVAIAFEEA
jgi:catechol 2,3-dioxygenase-like lactoylglutathione lyase family enzyme